MQTTNQKTAGEAMQLVEYLAQEEMTQTAFAKQVGCTSAHIGKILSRKHRPSVDLARKIEEVTEGAVTKEELLFAEK